MSHIRIDVENVSFGYETGKEVLKEISFHAGEGESVGLIGANGVGKSTMLKMLVGLNLQFSGTIRVENIPVEKNTLAENPFQNRLCVSGFGQPAFYEYRL